MQGIPLLLLATFPAVASQDAGWPQFLGPDRTGVVAETGWSATGAVAPLWTTNVGLGYSCPSIVGERLVTLGFDPDAQRDHVLCLHPRTGEELWRFSYEASDEPHYHGGGTLTTPTLADGVVYTLNRHGRAYALDLETGEPLWQRDYRAELGLPETFHGYCASPVVVRDRLIYLFGGSAAAVERADGDVLWHTEDQGDGAYTNPVVFELRGRTLVAAVIAQTFVALDVESGESVYEYPWPYPGMAVHVAQPLVIGDRVLISTAYGKGAAMLRLGDAPEPELLWTSQRLRNKVTGLYLHEGNVYGFDESMLKCFDLEGNEKWRVRGLGMGALSIVGGRLLILSSSGELIVAEATPEAYRELSRAQVLDGGSYWTMPVLVGGLIYVRNSLGDLACLDHRQAGCVAEAGPIAAVATPAPADLFAANADAVGATAIRAAAGLRLVGDWEILGRGMSRTPAAITFFAPNRWRLGLDSGQLVHTFDGELGWELKNESYRLFDEAEAGEAPRVLSLAELFAPTCPEGARVAPGPVSFAGRTCWRVVSAPRPAGVPRSVTHYFDVATGRLAGREGEDLSTTIFHGAQQVGAARLPGRIVIYRAGSGQEESFYVSGGEWGAPEEALFERPAGLQRLLRTPEQRAADTRTLRARYAQELGAYQEEEEPGPDGRLTVAVEDGDFMAMGRGQRMLLSPDPQAEGAFRMAGTGGATFRFERDEQGAVVGARLSFDTEVIVFRKLD